MNSQISTNQPEHAMPKNQYFRSLEGTLCKLTFWQYM